MDHTLQHTQAKEKLPHTTLFTHTPHTTSCLSPLYQEEKEERRAHALHTGTPTACAFACCPPKLSSSAHACPSFTCHATPACTLPCNGKEAHILSPLPGQGGRKDSTCSWFTTTLCSTCSCCHTHCTQAAPHTAGAHLPAHHTCLPMLPVGSCPPCTFPHTAFGGVLITAAFHRSPAASAFCCACCPMPAGALSTSGSLPPALPTWILLCVTPTLSPHYPAPNHSSNYFRVLSHVFDMVDASPLSLYSRYFSLGHPHTGQAAQHAFCHTHYTHTLPTYLHPTLHIPL